jgi:hypothetical protein
VHLVLDGQVEKLLQLRVEILFDPSPTNERDKRGSDAVEGWHQGSRNAGHDTADCGALVTAREVS